MCMHYQAERADRISSSVGNTKLTEEVIISFLSFIWEYKDQGYLHLYNSKMKYQVYPSLTLAVWFWNGLTNHVTKDHSKLKQLNVY